MPGQRGRGRSLRMARCGCRTRADPARALCTPAGVRTDCTSARQLRSLAQGPAAAGGWRARTSAYRYRESPPGRARCRRCYRRWTARSTAGRDCHHAAARRLSVWREPAVFSYAGTASLEKELASVDQIDDIAPGDVFIKGGFPGHAVLVADVAVNPVTKAKRFLLVQSFMPAQEMHVLRNPQNPDGSPWYSPPPGPLVTPEWTFPAGSLRRWP